MPFATRGGVRLHWRLDGAEGKTPIVLLNSIGTDMSLWDEVVPHLLDDCRLLRLDMRGHGKSDAPGGDYNLSMLAADVAAIMDMAGFARAAIAGVSLGGMVAMQIALDHSDRVSALVAICTSAQMDAKAWDQRVKTVREEGVAAIADLVMSRFLSVEFVKDHPGAAAGLRGKLISMADTGYAGGGAAIRDMDLLERLGAISAPTLVVTGDRDVSTPFAGHGALLLEGIPGATAQRLDCAHLPPVEAPVELAATMRRFLAHGQLEEIGAPRGWPSTP
ncbi:3-oxoadipate enol-lactonase [Ensifer adhaerens]|uniref:3-oxoadipate enol-lactonase n=1 Tax=Ensifer canadensis TaxID=555315 RepID=UPI00148F8C16|nr:3-oxoadipate enol-lactonase [Ensifer canadensis]NOV20415.1 3-oxoadipate enol-lactonase [Ensifer canadensis]